MAPNGISEACALSKAGLEHFPTGTKRLVGGKTLTRISLSRICPTPPKGFPTAKWWQAADTTWRPWGSVAGYRCVSFSPTLYVSAVIARREAGMG